MPRSPLRWLTVRYAPRPDERSFMDRAETKQEAGLEVTASVLSDHESRRFFGVNMARRGIQPLWVRIANSADRPIWPDLLSIDRAYYTPLEAAYVSHFAVGKRTFKTWNLTTHKIDPDVDESRDYVMACLMAGRNVSQLGYCDGVGPAPESSPRHNLTGDPYFTDGRRAVVILSSKHTDASFLGWAGLTT